MLSISDYAETLTLVLVFMVFLVFLGLFLRSKSTHGFQFSLFIFALILFAAEVPHILITLGILPMSDQFETAGLALHTLSMGVLSAAISYRFYRRIRDMGGKEVG